MVFPFLREADAGMDAGTDRYAQRRKRFDFFSPFFRPIDFPGSVYPSSLNFSNLFQDGA